MKMILSAHLNFACDCSTCLHPLQQLSQFWYDDLTASTLAQECLRASNNGRSVSTSCVVCYVIATLLGVVMATVVMCVYSRYPVVIACVIEYH